MYIILLHLYNNFRLLVDATIFLLFKWNSGHEERWNVLRKFTACSKGQDQLMNCWQIATQCFHHHDRTLNKTSWLWSPRFSVLWKEVAEQRSSTSSSQKQSKVRKESGQRHTPQWPTSVNQLHLSGLHHISTTYSNIKSSDMVTLIILLWNLLHRHTWSMLVS